MIALSVLDVRTFTSHLFLESTFDAFPAQEASVTTAYTVTFDGRLIREFFDEEELTSLPDSRFVLWERLRPLCYQIIKGKKLPRSFRIVLRLPEARKEAMLAGQGLSGDALSGAGFYLNIRYENGQLHVITGVSMNTFTTDRSAEEAWDNAVRAFLKRCGIACEDI